MHPIVSIIAMSALTVAVSTHADSGVTSPAAHYAQADQVSVIKVEGMTWTGCEAAVVQAAKSVAGVRDCKANYKTGTAEVTYDPAKTSPEAIARVIAKKTGYKATAPKKPR